MDGIINLDKPLGVTSAKALEQVREITGQRKSGHTGTLDPLASGVLVLCLGKATKLVEAFMDQPKIYRTAIALDVTSTSYDRERPLVPVPVAEPPTAERIAEVLRGFEGAIQQVPPATSALKIRGRPAYKFSRAGRPVSLTPRPVQIYWIHVRRYGWPELEIDVACGRGTYVRALVRDIGVRLGTGGCLSGLTRLAVGPFRIEDSWTPERLAAEGAGAALIALERARELLGGGPAEIQPRPRG